MAKRIESYETFEASSDAQRRMMLAMSSLERWIKLYEISAGIKSVPEPHVFSLYRSKNKNNHHASRNT